MEERKKWREIRRETNPSSIMFYIRHWFSHVITFVTAEPPGRGAIAANVVGSMTSLMQDAGGGLAAV